MLDNNIYFDESIRIGEDTRFWLEIAKWSEILLINEPLTVVNVDNTTHAQDSNKLIVGIKNLITYLLNDDYYSQYDQDIAVLCNYFFEINSDIREKSITTCYMKDR
ncbi:hypothetical protein IPL68_02610 [Candidatus Saccharibacteria bacterium]|nr:MAG: hypothetical protein IPL68_02610 [Candidatus Saccharibacteria bacterium]